MFRPCRPFCIKPQWLRALGTGSLTFALRVCFFASDAGRAYVQTFTSSLTGVVSDPQGGVVPNAYVEIKNTATNDTRQAKTGPDGS